METPTAGTRSEQSCPEGAAFLVLSGNSVALDLVTVRLKRAQFDVRTAATPQDAIASLRSGPFAGIFVDMRAAGLLDDEVLLQIRAADPEVSVVVLADEGDLEIGNWAARAGARTVLVRPFAGHDVVRAARAIAEPDEHSR